MRRDHPGFARTRFAGGNPAHCAGDTTLVVCYIKSSPPPFTDPFAVSPTFLLFSQLETIWQFGFSGLYWYFLRFWQDFDVEALVSLVPPQVCIIFFENLAKT